MSKTRSVPCGTCTLCCRGREAIILHPEDGDIAVFYQTTVIPHPLTGHPVHILKQKSDGSCHYHGATGCTIYDRRPAICRSFDCRAFAMKIPVQQQEAMVRAGVASRELLERGRALLSAEVDADQ